MKTILPSLVGVLLSTLLCATSYAQTADPAGPLRELDGGACWVQGSQDDGTWKVASFNDNQTFYVLRDSAIPAEDQRLEAKLNKELAALFPSFKKSTYKMHLHCSGGGHKVLITIKNPDNPLCVWAKKSDESNFSLKIESVYPDPNAHGDDPCYGVNPGTLLVTVKRELNPQDLADYMTKTFPEIIESIRVSKIIGYLSIQLKASYHFRETEVKKIFEADTTVMEQATSLDYDSKMTIPGETLPLLNGTYHGY